jgi:lysozyme family protein
VAKFAPAIQYVLANEGGFVNDPDDPGGITNFGISQRQFPQLDIASLTRDEAISIYERDYWKFGDLTSQRVAIKMLDIYVDLPPVPAIRLLQLALGFIEAGPIVCDGVLGPQTIEMANAADEDALMDELKAGLVKYYFDLFRDSPSQRTSLLMGWIRRAVKG